MQRHIYFFKLQVQLATRHFTNDYVVLARSLFVNAMQ